MKATDVYVTPQALPTTDIITPASESSTVVIGAGKPICSTACDRGEVLNQLASAACRFAMGPVSRSGALISISTLRWRIVISIKMRVSASGVPIRFSLSFMSLRSQAWHFSTADELNTRQADSGWPAKRACNCIHSIVGIVEEQRFGFPRLAWGEVASNRCSKTFALDHPSRPACTPGLGQSLGLSLTGYRLIYRDIFRAIPFPRESFRITNKNASTRRSARPSKLFLDALHSRC